MVIPARKTSHALNVQNYSVMGYGLEQMALRLLEYINQVISGDIVILDSPNNRVRQPAEALSERSERLGSLSLLEGRPSVENRQQMVSRRSAQVLTRQTRLLRRLETVQGQLRRNARTAFTGRAKPKLNSGYCKTILFH